MGGALAFNIEWAFVRTFRPLAAQPQEEFMDLKSDVVIVGGGLAGSLVALKLAIAKPDLHVVLVDTGETLGGHHTWSFHETDLDTPESLAWIQPLITKSWDDSSVQFPRLQKTLPGRFHAIRSDGLHKLLMEKKGDDVLLKARAVRMSESHVELENDHILAARCILDARGLITSPPAGVNGFQKFIAMDVLLETPHGLTSPIRIDATCPQLDGLRYFQLLPWDEKRLMVAEYFYSDSPELNYERISRSIQSFIERRGWKVAKIEREEKGVVPIPMTSDYLTGSVGGEALPIGMRGGYFHATTGRSLPDAVRLAELLATIEDLTTQNARDGLMKFRRAWLSRQSFYRLLNRWLFYASEPSLRYVVFQYFFGQQQDMIERFESGKSTWTDRFRVLSGRPPVPFDRAFRSLTERAIQSWAGARNVGSSQAPPPPTPPSA
jgi:lycopene beta-cyclase